MPRSLSTQAVNGMMAQETEQVYLLLLTFTHPDLSPDIYVVNNMENIISNGQEFIAYPFALSLPIEGGDQVAGISVTIDNVDLSLIEMIRGLDSPPSAQVDVILAASPNTIELSITDLVLREATYDAQVITGKLSMEDILNQAWPNISYTPSQFPGMFNA